MAFNMKQLRTCKELMKLSKIPRYMKSSYNPMGERIYVRFGQFYVTNSYVIVCVEWDEYQHAGDDEWKVLSRFMDNAGKLIPFEFEASEMQRANDIFSRMFIKKVDYSNQLPVNAHLLRDVLKVFEINDLTPIIVQDGSRYELSAHNNEVSIKALVMGLRR